jgi:hypothetical protein
VRFWNRFLTACAQSRAADVHARLCLGISFRTYT